MEAADVEPVQLLRRVVDGVESPEEWMMVREHVKPVPQKVGGQDHDYQLYADRKLSRPQSRDPRRTRLQPGNQGDRDEKRERLRQQSLDDEHEKEIALHVLRRRLPRSLVRNAQLQPGDRRHPEEDRGIGARQEGEPRLQQKKMQRDAANHHYGVGKVRQ